ncbi:MULTISPECIES: cold-shock protein [unclassified Kitasatospora]|uniref:cold-shock protein n=1 Tax=unclassified Kitasatospora TaxID=2633591 RepID=UPI000710006B|nr:MULTISPECIES: cold-shock protein [unclassified Kitasatospora]KQV24147.1 cold-shock protein [Kitasatospora sp. Root107]KRB67138.1 cold-shock protein [Kitasatospora sp. Root187]
MPTGQVKWFNETKGFGFLSRDDGGDVFVHTKALPAGVTALRPGQRVEFGVVAGHRGDQAMSVTLLEALPSVAAAQRKSADDMAPIVQDLITTLDAVLAGLQHNRYPAKPTGEKLAALLRGVADQFDV